LNALVLQAKSGKVKVIINHYTIRNRPCLQTKHQTKHQTKNQSASCARP